MGREGILSGVPHFSSHGYASAVTLVGNIIKDFFCTFKSTTTTAVFCIGIQLIFCMGKIKYFSDFGNHQNQYRKSDVARVMALLGMQSIDIEVNRKRILFYQYEIMEIINTENLIMNYSSLLE